MTKRFSFILVVLAVILLVLFSLSLQHSTPIRRLIISSEDLSSITAARTPDDSLQASIWFDEEELLYEDAAGCYFYSLPENSSSAYEPSVRVTSPEGAIQLAFVGDGGPAQELISDEGIAKNDSIRVILYNDTRYCERLLKCTLLPILSIRCEETISELYSGMSMSLFDNGSAGNARMFLSDGKIRIRGGITSEYPKLPFRISLQVTSVGNNPRKNPASLLGMPKHSDWVLYPAYNDSSKVRNVFSQNLWTASCSRNNDHGIQTGVQYRFLELFVNGKYHGLYALGYTPDESMLGIDTRSTDAGLFKKVLDTRDDRFSFQNDLEERVIGYRLIHEERNDQTSDEDDYLKRWDSLLDYYRFLADHAEDSAALLDAMDLANAIDYYLFVGLIQGDDSIYKNYYLAIFGDERRPLYCPWDMDATWGNEYSKPAHNFYLQDSHTPWYNFFMVSSYLNQLLVNGDTDMPERLFRRYQELRSDAWSDERIDEMLAGYEREIFSSGAYLREMERWPDGDYLVAPSGDVPRYDLSKFRSYVRDRLHAMDDAWERIHSLADESILVQRTAFYMDFDRSDIIMEINDHSILKDPAFLDLIDHINSTADPASAIDLHMIDAQTRYVVFLRKEGKTWYVPDFGGKDHAVPLGDPACQLIQKRDETRDYYIYYGNEGMDGYTLFLQRGKEICGCYEKSDSFYEPLIISVICDGYGEKMDVLMDYSPEFSDPPTQEPQE